MDLLYVLGSMGGALFLFGYIIDIVKSFIKLYRKYTKMKCFYEHHNNSDSKPPMGFMTDKEREEIEDRLVAKKRAF